MADDPLKNILLGDTRNQKPDDERRVFHMSDLLKEKFADEVSTERSRLSPRDSVLPPMTRTPLNPSGTPVEGAAASQSAENAAFPKTESRTPRLRTFKDDLNKAMRAGATISSIAAQEFDKRTEVPQAFGEMEPPTPQKKSFLLNAIAVLAGLFLIGSGVFALSLFSEKFQKLSTGGVTEQHPLLLSRYQEKLSLGNKPRETLLREISDARKSISGERGSIVEFIVEKENDRGEQVPARLTDLFAAVKADVPGTLERSISEYFYGLRVGSENGAFLAFKVASRETAFAEMLSWEQTIEDGAGPLFRDRSEFSRVGTSTATRLFRDIVIRNRDARLLRNEANKTLLVYAFLPDNFVLIASDEETLGDIVEKINTAPIKK